MLTVGKTYKLYWPIGTETVAKLERVDTFRFLPSHLVFKYVSGDDSLVCASVWFEQGLFPVPEGLMDRLRVDEL